MPEEKKNQNANQELQNAPETGVVFDNKEASAQPAQPAAPVSGIPEEYLTDEDLYPVSAENHGGNMKKKIPLAIILGGGLLVLVVLVLLFVKLLGGGKAATVNKVELSYWGLWESETVMNEIIGEYEKLNPNIHITYTQMDAKSSYIDRLVERTKKGTGPDILKYHNTWVPLLTDILAPAPSTVFTSDEFASIFYPVVAKDLDLEGKIVGVPLSLDGLVILYNSDILKAAGVAQVPADWESLISVAQKVTVREPGGEIITAGLAVGTADNIAHFSDIMGLMFLQNGVDVRNLEGDVNALTVLDAYTNFALSTNNVWSDTLDNSLIAFANGRVAMIFAPVWRISSLRLMNPDLKLAVAPVPQVKGGEQAVLANYWVEGVSRGSEHQKEAWEFLKFLTEKGTLEKLYDLDMKADNRLFGNPYPRQDMAELLVNHEYLGPLVNEFPNFKTLPLVSFTYDNSINDRLSAYLKDAVNGVLYNSSPATALSTLDKGFKQVFLELKY